MDEMTVKALAKINIGLDVTGMREDGYHLVRMIMQTVHMYDLVTVSKSAETGISMRIIFVLRLPSCWQMNFPLRMVHRSDSARGFRLRQAWLEAVQMRQPFYMV